MEIEEHFFLLQAIVLKANKLSSLMNLALARFTRSKQSYFALTLCRRHSRLIEFIENSSPRLWRKRRKRLASPLRSEAKRRSEDMLLFYSYNYFFFM
jgi:hypothetical protein